MAKTKPMSIERQVKMLDRRYGGHIKPEQLVAEARRQPHTPLGRHFKFEDVRGAAEAHWLQQARELIRTIKYTVVVEDTSYKIPYYRRDPSQPAGEQGYVSMLVLRKDPVNSIIAATEELEQAERHLRRAEIIATVLGVKKAAAQARRSVERARKISEQAQASM